MCGIIQMKLYSRGKQEKNVMSENLLHNHDFGTAWKTIHIYRREGFYTSVTDYHEHPFYEINLILSGNVKIILKDRFEEGCRNHIVLARPGTPHYIACKPDTLYRRIYLVFSGAFMENCFPEWKQLSAIFGDNGNILTVTEEETAFFQSLLEQIEDEKSIFGQRLLTYYLLLRLSERTEENGLKKEIPPYIFEALTYLENHHAEKINFTSLAKQLYVGRTTLMTEFKAHTGSTMGEYLCKCRLKNAIPHLLQKQTIEYTAEECGFSDSSGFIRAFKRHYGITPHQYVKSMK